MCTSAQMEPEDTEEVSRGAMKRQASSTSEPEVAAHMDNLVTSCSGGL